MEAATSLAIYSAEGLTGEWPETTHDWRTELEAYLKDENLPVDPKLAFPLLKAFCDVGRDSLQEVFRKTIVAVFRVSGDKRNSQGNPQRVLRQSFCVCGGGDGGGEHLLEKCYWLVTFG